MDQFRHDKMSIETYKNKESLNSNRISLEYF